MPGLEDLYREIILDHYRNPRNRGELPVPPALRTEGFNPLCGDEIQVFLEMDDDRDGDKIIEPDDDVKLGDLEAPRGVVKFPVRIKCATLAWNTLTQGLDEAATN